MRGCGVRRYAVTTAVLASALALAAGCATSSAAARTVTGAGQSPAGWRVVPSAAIACTSAVGPGDRDAVVIDIGATSASDAWAAGVCGADGGTHDYIGQSPSGFVEHWNGRNWAQVRVPASGEYDMVRAVSPGNVWVASAAGDPWVIGRRGHVLDTAGGASVIHWNGAAWTEADRGAGYLSALAADPAGGMWALSYRDPDHPDSVLLHWSAGRWRLVAGPAGMSFAITAGGSGDCAISRCIGGFLGSSRRGGMWLGGTLTGGGPAIARYTGGGWTVSAVPAPGSGGWINAMTVTDHGVWVELDRSGAAPTLDRYDGHTWTAVSARYKPDGVTWPEINPGLNYRGYLLCQFSVSAAARAAVYGFGWTCPPASLALDLVPGMRQLWAAGMTPGSPRPRIIRSGG